MQFQLKRYVFQARKMYFGQVKGIKKREGNNKLKIFAGNENLVIFLEIAVTYQEHFCLGRMHFQPRRNIFWLDRMLGLVGLYGSTDTSFFFLSKIHFYYQEIRRFAGEPLKPSLCFQSILVQEEHFWLGRMLGQVRFEWFHSYFHLLHCIAFQLINKNEFPQVCCRTISSCVIVIGRTRNT